MFVKTILMFFIIFSIRFYSWQFILSPRIIALVFSIILSNWNKFHLIKFIKLTMSDIRWILSSIFVLLYSWLIFVLNNVGIEEFAMVAPAFNFLVLVVLFPYFTSNMFLDEKEFSRCLLYASFIQSIIVFLSFLFLPFRFFLESIQAADVTRYGWRIIGLGIAGSGGSVYLLCGFISGIYLMMFSKKRITDMLCTISILLSIALVGRTGFYVALVILIYFILFNSKSLTKKMKNNIKLIGFISIAILTIYFILSIANDRIVELLSYTYKRLLELFREGFGSSTIQGINNYSIPLPGISRITLIGTGIIRGYSSTGLLFMNDSGYIQRYAAVGLVVCIFSYISFVVYMIELAKKISKTQRRFVLLCLFLLLIIEYKEPFIYMLAYPFTLVMISKLASRKQSQVVIPKRSAKYAKTKYSSDNI